MIDYEWYVLRNGKKAAGPFSRRNEAAKHANRMHAVSISLNRYHDKWHVNAEKKES